ncbi:hypothetical protein GCM10009869_05950 [Amnibacterium kyonggiense]
MVQHDEEGGDAAQPVERVEALPVPPTGDDGRGGDRVRIAHGDGPFDLDRHPAAPGRGVVTCGGMPEPYRLPPPRERSCGAQDLSVR